MVQGPNSLSSADGLSTRLRRPCLCWFSAVPVVAAVISVVEVSILATIDVASRDHIYHFTLAVDACSYFSSDIAPTAELVFVIRMCSVDGILSISPTFGVVHQMID